MKNLFTAAFFTLLLTINPAYADGSSSAAWDGQYAGFTLGASHGTADPTVGTRNLGYFITTDPGQVNPQASTNLNKTDLSGNLFCGFNRQTGNTVYGLETDIALDNFNERYSSGNISYISAPAIAFSVTTSVKSDWSISLRPRIGHVFKDSLLYVSAGPSIRRFEYNFTYYDNNGPPRSASFSDSKWALGWTAGMGYDYRMQDDWSLRAEYLYSSYKNIVNTLTTFSFGPTDGFAHTLDFQAHSLRVGLVKRF